MKLPEKEDLETIRRILAVCMESPFYFTIPLRRRFDFIKDLEQRAGRPGLQPEVSDQDKEGN